MEKLVTNMNFETALAFVLEWEGGYVWNPKDPGGETNFGITKYTARSFGYKGSMKNIPRDVVDKIYKEEYWDKCKCDKLISFGLQLAVFDAAVNSGVERSIKLLQEVIRVTRDGIIGPETIKAVSSMNPTVITNNVIVARLQFLKGLKTWPVFGDGWTRRINELKKIALSG